jgi:hypothetical protein
LKNEERWAPDEIRSHQAALEILRRLHIDYEDLWPILRDEISQHSIAETADDQWHPNDRAAELIAAHLKSVHFLERD